MSNPTAESLHWEISQTIKEFGELCRLKYYSYSFSGADFDSAFLSASGNALWIYGFIQNINRPNDFEYLAQGRIQQSDSKLYVCGSLDLTPTNGQIKIGIGSPIKMEYYTLQQGCSVYSLNGSDIYTKSFIRVLNNGSFINEI